MLTFGVEIECLVPFAHRAGLAAGLQQAAVPCVDVGRYHSGLNTTAWKIERDGSLRGDPGFDTVELVSPPLTADSFGFDQVERLCSYLATIGAAVNRSCGLHVHVGIGHVTVAAVRKLAELYIKHEGLIDQLIPPSRRGNINAYCQSVALRADLTALARANSVRDVAFAATRDARHSKLNLSSYWRYQTVEFRHHSGTVDAAKIIKWVNFCVKMVESAIRDANQPVSVPMGGATATRPTGWWSRRETRRTLYALLNRPEGVTNEELRVANGRSSRPLIRELLVAASAPVYVTGMRNGLEVFRLYPVETTTEQPAVAAPLTLAALYEQLQLPDEDKAFWQARQQALSRSGIVQRRPVRPVGAVA